MKHVSRASSSRVRDYPFLGFPSFTETYDGFAFAQFVGFDHRWTTFLFLPFVCEPFPPDLKTNDNARLLDWIDVVSGPPVLIFMVDHRARTAQENRNHIFL
jgi:hypothetical protein